MLECKSLVKYTYLGHVVAVVVASGVLSVSPLNATSLGSDHHDLRGKQTKDKNVSKIHNIFIVSVQVRPVCYVLTRGLDSFVNNVFSQ